LGNLIPFVVFCAVVMTGAMTGAQDSRDSDQTMMSFELEDQFGNVYTDGDYRGQVVVVTCGDRKGSEYTVAWGRAMIRAMDPNVRLTGVRYIQVADLRGVPFFAKKAVRKKFPRDETQWALLDWKGQWAKTYGFESKAANILVFDDSGALLIHAHGREPDEEQVQGIVGAIKKAVGSR